MSGPGFIKAEGKLRCTFCGEQKELRPYGKHSELICFDCGIKDEETTTKMFIKFVHMEEK